MVARVDRESFHLAPVVGRWPAGVVKDVDIQSAASLGRLNQFEALLDFLENQPTEEEAPRETDSVANN